MKLIAIKRAFYDNRLLEKGQAFDFAGQKVPSWAREPGEAQKVIAPEHVVFVLLHRVRRFGKSPHALELAPLHRYIASGLDPGQNRLDRSDLFPQFVIHRLSPRPRAAGNS